MTRSQPIRGAITHKKEGLFVVDKEAQHRWGDRATADVLEPL